MPITDPVQPEREGTRVLVDVLDYGRAKGTRVRLPDGSARWVSPDSEDIDESYDSDGTLRFYLWVR